jgi:hypothetical protein
MLTTFTTGAISMGKIFDAADEVFFRRADDIAASELWVLDDSVPEGARLFVDLNQGGPPNSGIGYEPEQVVAAPDPFQSSSGWLLGVAT